jgi:hypothetical protein
VTAVDVMQSPRIADPLRELMLPAESTGAIAVVLGSLARSRRARATRAILTGWGQASSDTTAGGRWLRDPSASARRAAQEAYRRAGIARASDEIGVVELTAASPALVSPTLDALQLGLAPTAEVVQPSGGVRSNFPGTANGALRLLEAVSFLETHGGRAVSHSADLLTGTVADTATVLVVEAV